MVPAISVEGLGKCYQVRQGQARRPYSTLRESLSDFARESIHRLLSPNRAPAAEEFWALKDISFEVQPGEVVGVIGPNGAGKSTLLKILSRITTPTRGQVKLHGRVGSLLEVGTGFHPELTGRENIYLNGSILGMSRREIARRFDEIVAFAEVAEFLDTPVKRYSSGMYVRLAFAVAAHLEPEILMVDEVLAVGDASYQRRCIERMTRLAQSGITVLFVSHNMELIPRFCQRAILLRKGRIDLMGQSSEVTERYLDALSRWAIGADLGAKRHSGDGRAVFSRLELIGADGRSTSRHVSGDDLVLRIHIDARQQVPDVALAVVLQNCYGTRVLTSWTREAGYQVNLTPGSQVIECRFHNVRLRPGHRVQVSLWMATQSVVDAVEEAGTIEVVASPETKHFSTNQDQGIMLCDHTWRKLSPDCQNCTPGDLPATA